MATKVVSTKLTIEEHGKFLEVCKKNNSTPSALIKKSILSLISKENVDDLSSTQSEKKLTKSTKIEEKIIEKTIPPNFKQLQNNDASCQELIEKFDNNELSRNELNELYHKLSEKYDQDGLSKLEESLFRKVHQQLSNKPKPVVETKKLSLEERLQYF